jgi:lipoprotein signal peptidase
MHIKKVTKPLSAQATGFDLAAVLGIIVGAIGDMLDRFAVGTRKG